MASQRILIVEDDSDIAEMIVYNFKKEGWHTLVASDGEEALRLSRRQKPDLMVLDLMLPGIDGLEVLRRLRGDQATAAMPVIMLTAKSQEADKVIGLEMGADDYMIKPFSPRELIARVKAVLRRFRSPLSGKSIRIGDLVVDSQRYKVKVRGRDVAFTPKEFKLLEFLAQRPGVVVSRATILDEVFGYDSAIYDRTVDAHVKSLRRKLGKARDYIETVRSAGYRMKEA